MNIIAFYRTRILTYVLLAVLAGFAGWWSSRYQPRLSALEVKQAEMERKQGLIRKARSEMVSKGIPGMEKAIAADRAEALRLARRVPQAADAGQGASEITELVTQAARRFNVHIRNTQPVALQDTIPFRIEGLTIQAVGSYHDIGSFLTEVLSFERITQLRGARLDVVPDSVMATALKDVRSVSSTPRRSGPAVQPSVNGLDDDESMIPEGEAPFTVSVVFTLNWFSLSEGMGPSLSRGGATTGEGQTYGSLTPSTTTNKAF